MNSRDRNIFITIILFLSLILIGELFYYRSRSEDISKVVTDSEKTKRQELTLNDAFQKEVVYTRGALNLKGYLCKPQGQGPFPTVIYNHGRDSNGVSGVPEETCDYLSRSDFVGFSPIRRSSKDQDVNLSDVQTAVDYVSQLEYVDRERIGIMGFSDGGALAFRTASKNEFGAHVFLASDQIKKEELEKLTKKFVGSTLILVAKNDLPGKKETKPNYVKVARQMKDILETAEKEVDLIVYPAFGDNGHLMFHEIGDYWDDVTAFLEKNLKT